MSRDGYDGFVYQKIKEDFVAKGHCQKFFFLGLEALKQVSYCPDRRSLRGGIAWEMAKV